MLLGDLSQFCYLIPWWLVFQTQPALGMAHQTTLPQFFPLEVSAPSKVEVVKAVIVHSFMFSIFSIRPGDSAWGARRGVRQDRCGRRPGPQDTNDHQTPQGQGGGPVP